MSRTFKDCPSRIRYPEEAQWDYDRIETDNAYNWLKKPGVKTKKRKEKDTEWHWMSTPSWWTRLTMNRPQRRKSKLWENKISRTPLDLVEDEDTPNVSKKPHNYYW